jgi:hypothetical protein
LVAGILGGMLARGGDPASRGALEPSLADARRAARSLQLRGAAFVTGFALAFDLLFFAVDELPATVPVALGLLALLLTRRRFDRRDAWTRRARVTARGVRG